MQKLIDTGSFNPPTNLEKDWIWVRILIQIHYTQLAEVNSLQWALLQIFTDFENELPGVSEIALMLGLEPLLIEEVLSNLTFLNVINLKSREDSSQLSNYEFNQKMRNSFLKYSKICMTPTTQKVILFKYEDEYRYQLIERVNNNNTQRKKREKIKTKQKSQTPKLKFENVLLVAIEQIWAELEHHNQELFTKGEKELHISNQELLSNSEYIVDRIEVNFLS